MFVPAKAIRATIVLCLALLVSGCKETSVTVSCGNLSDYESATGILNGPQFDLGYVLLLNTRNKSAHYVRVLKIPDSEQTSTAPKTTTEAFNSTLSFSFTGNLPPSAIQATIESAITKETQLKITNAARTSITNVLKVVNGDKELRDYIKGRDADSEVIIVHTVVPAENMSLVAKDATSGSAGAQIIKSGDYKVTVKYECNNALEQIATHHRAAMFFKFDALKYNATTHEIDIDDSFPATLKGYNLGGAAIM